MSNHQLDATRMMLPLLDASGMCRLLAGLSASVHCTEACRQEQRRRLRCPTTQVLACFADNRTHGLADPLADPLSCFRQSRDVRDSCRCVSPVLGPPVELTPFAVALVVAGQTRSFTSPLVSSAFKTLVSRLPSGEAVMLAVLTTESTNRGDLRPGGWHSVTRFTTTALDKTMHSLGLPWRARYLSNSGSPSEAAAACSNEELRNLLATASGTKKLPEGGMHGSLIKRVVAFDLLLSYEQSTQRTPERVLFLRPDTVYILDVAALDPNCSTGVYVRNDQFAAMPRRLAGYYFTSYATDRSLHGAGDEPPSITVIGQAKQLASPAERDLGGLTLMPHFHLAYYGVPFAGGGLEMDPNNIDCAGYTPLVQMLAIRDLPSFDSTPGVCYNKMPNNIEVRALLARFNVSACTPASLHQGSHHLQAARKRERIPPPSHPPPPPTAPLVLVVGLLVIATLGLCWCRRARASKGKEATVNVGAPSATAGHNRRALEEVTV